MKNDSQWSGRFSRVEHPRYVTSVQQALMFLVMLAALLASLVGCGGGSPSTKVSPQLPPPSPTTPTTPTAANVATIIVSEPAVSNPQPPNKPFVSVTVCVPGTSTCQTIPSVMIDTESAGLRLFSSVATLSLPQQTGGTSSLGAWECASFQQNWMWGPVVTADVQISGEKASAIPIHLVGNATQGPAECNTGSYVTSPQQVGMNGILGLGFGQYDCGLLCVNAPTAAYYYTCPDGTGSGCASTTESLVSQVQNPVALFASDNNGYVIALPSISTAGATGVTGSLIFGIGTQTNNALGSATVLTPDNTGRLTATFNGFTFPSVPDSGANAILFLDSTSTGLPQCEGIYCPSSPQVLNATLQGSNGAFYSFDFPVANISDATQVTPNTDAWNDYAGPAPQFFQFGMPFFYGRNVFVAIAGQSSAGGTGPYWAF
jgi:Protein of unknown function (DUF3443)